MKEHHHHIKLEFGDSTNSGYEEEEEKKGEMKLETSMLSIIAFYSGIWNLFFFSVFRSRSKRDTRIKKISTRDVIYGCFYLKPWWFDVFFLYLLFSHTMDCPPDFFCFNSFSFISRKKWMRDILSTDRHC